MEVLKAGASPFMSRYSPQRDLLLVFPDMVLQAAQACDPEKITCTNESKETMKTLGVEPAGVQEALRLLLLASGQFAHAETPTARLALEASGFLALPEADRTIALAKLGQVCVRAFLSYAREGSYMEDVTESHRTAILSQIADMASIWKPTAPAKWYVRVIRAVLLLCYKWLK